MLNSPSTIDRRRKREERTETERKETERKDRRRPNPRINGADGEKNRETRRKRGRRQIGPWDHGDPGDPHPNNHLTTTNEQQASTILHPARTNSHAHTHTHTHTAHTHTQTTHTHTPHTQSKQRTTRDTTGRGDDNPKNKPITAKSPHP